VTNPLPLACTLLTVLLPLVFLTGRRLTDWVAREPDVRVLLAPMAALGAWLVAVGIAGRLTGSFVAGLSLGTLLVAVIGVAWTLQGRARRESLPPAPFSANRASFYLVAAAGALATLPVAYLTLAGDFFDDYNLIGHRSLVAQFQNDVYPPRHQVYPDYPFRYHYAFNIMAAALTALFRLPVGVAIDAVVIFGFFASFCLAWRLGERLSPSSSGAWTAVFALLSGGAFFWFLWHSDWAQHGAVGIVIGGNRINFPVVMYFFQKPFALGFPLALAVMLLLSVRADGIHRTGRGLALAVLLAPLSFAEVVLFVTMLPSVAAHELAADRRLRALVPSALALTLAVPLGGVLFTPMPEEHVGLIRARFWLAEHPPGGVFQWYFLTTGLLLPLAIWGIRALPQMKRFFLLLIVGSFGVPLVFDNPQSWDIVKFSTVGQLAAGILSGLALARIVSRRSPLRVTAAVFLVILLMASPVGYLSHWVREIVRPTPEIGQLLQAQRAPHEIAEWSRLIAWLRRAGPPEGAIFCQNPLLLRQLLFAGLYTAGPSEINAQFGIPRERVRRRQALLDDLPRDPAAWSEEGVLWIVTGPGEPMGRLAASWAAGRKAQHAASAGPWHLYRLNR
jgi:hypothetical protein